MRSVYFPLFRLTERLIKPELLNCRFILYLNWFPHIYVEVAGLDGLGKFLFLG